MNDAVPIVEGFADLVEVGRGGFSRVFAAYQAAFDRRIAIKVLNDRLADDASVEAFEWECQAMGALSRHPFIVTVLASAFTSEYRPCIVMDLFEQGNYMQLLRRDGPLPLEELLSLSVRLAGALATAHQDGVIHGDVKPQNIFKSAFGYPALGDFGIARLRNRLAERAGLGLSPHYAAPELTEVGADAAGAAADQYSLAATIYTLATGRRPFESAHQQTPQQVLTQALSAPVPTLPAGFPRDLTAAMRRAMAREPQDRFPDLSALAVAFANIEHRLGHRPTAIPIAGIDDDATIAIDEDTLNELRQHATEPPPPTDARPFALTSPQEPPPPDQPPPDQPQPRRRRRRRALVALVVILLAGIAAYLLTRAGETTPTAQTPSPPQPEQTVQPPSGAPEEPPLPPPPTEVPATAPGSEPAVAPATPPASAPPPAVATPPGNEPPTPPVTDVVEAAEPPERTTTTAEPAMETPALSGRFSAVSSGLFHSCGLRADSTVECWGLDDDGQASPPPDGHFSAIAAGGAHTCALRADGAVECWGLDDDGQASPPPDRHFNAISAGGDHACGLHTDGTIACWGQDPVGQATPPDGRFTAVSAGWTHSCGLRANETITCWGDKFAGKTDSPAGTFTAVAAGWNHSCGLRSGATITCWGANSDGQSAAPTGSYLAVAAGWTHSCGLRSDSSIACWGNNSYGQTEAPAGAFTAISAGWNESCGVRSDETITCWGRENAAGGVAPEGREGMSERTVELSKGANAQGDDSGCSIANCHFLRVELVNFEPGDYTVHCWHHPVPSAGWAHDTWTNYSTSDTVSEHCIWGVAGHQVHVIVEDPSTGQTVRSNDAEWP